MSSDIIGIRPNQYIHVLDQNTSITRLEVGPKTWVCQTHEKVTAGPLPYVVVPPGHYCTVVDPCRKYVHGEPCKLDFGHRDIRFHGEPFALYPGETLQHASSFGKTSNTYNRAIQPLPVLKAGQGLLLHALLEHTEGKVKRNAGDRWMVRGPCTYKPVPEVEIVGTRNECIIKPGESLHIVATNECVDHKNKKRVTGEEWLISDVGGYLPDVFEEVKEVLTATAMTPTLGIHLRAEVSLVDTLGKKRVAGEEWLVTSEDTDTLYPHVHIKEIRKIEKTVLGKGHFCVVYNPIDANGRPQLGCKDTRQGCLSFFLHPGESASAIQDTYVTGKDEAIVLSAVEDFVDEDAEGKPHRKSGERWMILGPISYVPRNEVMIHDTRTAVPLNKNEGLYVRNIRTGSVRAVMGPQSYLLKEYEEPFKKELPQEVEELLKKGGGGGSGDIRKIAYFEQSIDPAILRGRDATKIIKYRCPGNTACQVYNYRQKTARVVFGPDLVILGPDENFNVLSLSAGKPKKTNALKSLVLMLGPDFISDIIVVETSDHARLQVALAFNNHFEYDVNDQDIANKLFSVPDFIGFACKEIGGRIRATVAQITFDEFHRNSMQVIQHAVFGPDLEADKKPLKFPANNLVVTSVDVQSIEPVDIKMRESLMKSVQMAIEIATQSIEAAAAHEAERLEQKARGELERQQLVNDREAEEARINLLKLRAETAAVESTGQAVAEARANAESVLIECHSAIDCARLKAEAENIEHKTQLETQNQAKSAELKYIKCQDDLEISQKKQLTKIEMGRFSNMVSVLGRDTLQAIATSGPDMKVKLLEGLGIQSMMITDGNNPINLFNTAEGLIGGQGQGLFGSQ